MIQVSSIHYYTIHYTVFVLCQLPTQQCINVSNINECLFLMIFGIVSAGPHISHSGTNAGTSQSRDLERGRLAGHRLGDPPDRRHRTPTRKLPFQQLSRGWENYKNIFDFVENYKILSIIWLLGVTTLSRETRESRNTQEEKKTGYDKQSEIYYVYPQANLRTKLHYYIYIFFKPPHHEYYTTSFVFEGISSKMSWFSR